MKLLDGNIRSIGASSRLCFRPLFDVFIIYYFYLKLGGDWIYVCFAFTNHLSPSMFSCV